MKDVSAAINVSINVVGSPDADDLDLASAIAKVALSRGKTMANGTGSDQVNTWYSDVLGVTGGSNDTIDLQGGGDEVDAFGNSLDIDKLKILYLKNLSDAAMTIGPEAQGLSIVGDIATDIIPLPVGAEILMIFGGQGVTVDGTHKDLFIGAAGSGTKNIEILIVGVTSA